MVDKTEHDIYQYSNIAIVAVVTGTLIVLALYALGVIA